MTNPSIPGVETMSELDRLRLERDAYRDMLNATNYFHWILDDFRRGRADSPSMATAAGVYQAASVHLAQVSA